MKAASTVKVLLTDDRSAIMRDVKATLDGAGYHVATVPDGAAALLAVPTLRPNLLVLDVELPKVSGLEVCRQIRRDQTFADLRILLLTRSVDQFEKVTGLAPGIDDFLARPVHLPELVLRARRLVQTLPPPASDREEMALGDLHVDISRHQVTAEGKPIHLTVLEFNLLTVLAKRRGRVQTRERILQDVWEYNSQLVDTRTIDTHMRRLRNKLGSASRYLETVRGIGYRFRDSASFCQ